MAATIRCLAAWLWGGCTDGLGWHVSTFIAACDSSGSILTFGFFAILALVWARRLPFSENGDGLLETIMSLQKVTLYFWGEDRFANLLPAATLWIRNPTDNAYVQMGCSLR